jgi:hypothetical protein
MKDPAVFARISPFPGQDADAWIAAYRDEVLQSKDAATIDAYCRILTKFTNWLAQRPGNNNQFHPQAGSYATTSSYASRLGSCLVVY